MNGTHSGVVINNKEENPHCLQVRVFFSITVKTCPSFLRGKEVVLRQLEVVIVAKLSQHSPGGFMASTLNEEAMEEEEAPQSKGVSMNTIRDIPPHYSLQFLQCLGRSSASLDHIPLLLQLSYSLCCTVRKLGAEFHLWDT